LQVNIFIFSGALKIRVDKNLRKWWKFRTFFDFNKIKIKIFIIFWSFASIISLLKFYIINFLALKFPASLKFLIEIQKLKVWNLKASPSWSSSH
jgi:hypothetical protein